MFSVTFPLVPSVKVCSCVEPKSYSVLKSFSFVDRNDCVFSVRVASAPSVRIVFVEREPFLRFAVSVASALGRGVAGVSRVTFARVSRVSFVSVLSVNNNNFICESKYKLAEGKNPCINRGHKKK